MASREKKPPLHEIDLAIAATLPADKQKRFIEDAISGQGYDRFRSTRAVYPILFNTSTLLPMPPLGELKSMIERLCPKGRKGEIDGNKALVEAANKYSLAHTITSTKFDFRPVDLRRAGKRYFWFPLMLKIDGQEYIPFFDHRLHNGLTADAMRFIFSINHSHFREQDPTKFKKTGFVIFRFERNEDGSRVMVPHFEKGVQHWTMEEIGSKIDATYRALDEIRRAA